MVIKFTRIYTKGYVTLSGEATIKQPLENGATLKNKEFAPL